MHAGIPILARLVMHSCQFAPESTMQKAFSAEALREPISVFLVLIGNYQRRKVRNKSCEEHGSTLPDLLDLTAGRHWRVERL